MRQTYKKVGEKCNKEGEKYNVVKKKYNVVKKKYKKSMSVRAECQRHEAWRLEHPKMYLPELYSSPTIQSRSAARRAAQDLVFSN